MNTFPQNRKPPKKLFYVKEMTAKEENDFDIKKAKRISNEDFERLLKASKIKPSKKG